MRQPATGGAVAESVGEFGSTHWGEALHADDFFESLLGETALSPRPTPGSYYQIRRGDSLFAIAGRAYGVPPGAQRLRMARLINDHAFNRRLWRQTSNKFFPQGLISFFPRFASADRQLAARDNPPPRGNQFAVIFIPSPDVTRDLTVSLGRAGGSEGLAGEAAEENLRVDIVVGQDHDVHARATRTQPRSFTWTSADPAIAAVTRTDAAATNPNHALIRGVSAGTTTVDVEYVSNQGQTFRRTVDVVVTAVPRPTRCRTFVPTATNTIVVAQREFTPPAGLTVTNWADPTVGHKDNNPRGRQACREVNSVTELIVHETVTRTINRGGTGRPRVQLVLHRDGTFTQHADLAHDLPHANHHNAQSFGFETVNPVLPRIAGAPDNGVPRDLVRFPVIRNTTWAGQDIPRDDDGNATGPARNRSRHYVRPTDAQLESATRLIEWATDRTIGHGMNIPRTFVGLRGNFFLFGRDDPLFTGAIPGILAHGYFRHSDGAFVALYAWLRLERGMNAATALTTAIDLAASHVRARRHQPGARRTSHANVTHIVAPPAPTPTP